jgi:hypothetical protein
LAVAGGGNGGTATAVANGGAISTTGVVWSASRAEHWRRRRGELSVFDNGQPLALLLCDGRRRSVSVNSQVAIDTSGIGAHAIVAIIGGGGVSCVLSWCP